MDASSFQQVPFWIIFSLAPAWDKVTEVLQIEAPDVVEEASANILSTEDMKDLVVDKGRMVASPFWLLPFESELPPVWLDGGYNHCRHFISDLRCLSHTHMVMVAATSLTILFER